MELVIKSGMRLLGMLCCFVWCLALTQSPALAVEGSRAALRALPRGKAEQCKRRLVVRPAALAAGRTRQIC